ncbi:ATP-binding protein [Nocardioides sp.]|uniref:sensor histidine kinase n=1 Tax=Nocardioides sp. TaxID=35761 RepID=UPI002B275D1F|nr:ATP-binding protein [Nocardioides sp.]
MGVRLRWRIALLLLLLFGAGVGSSASAPDAGFIAGVWPLGLATGILMLTPRRQEPALLVLVLGVAVGSVALLAQPLDVALGFGLGVTLAAWTAARLLTTETDGVRSPAALRTDSDLRKWLVACVGSAFLGGLSLTLTAVVTGVGLPLLTGIGVAIALLAAQLIVTPFFLRLPSHRAVAPDAERISQWLVLVIATPLLLLSVAASGLIFLTIPVLAWGALRGSAREALGQLVWVVAFALGLSVFGRGPFPPDVTTFGVPDEIRGVLLSGYAITCAVIVVPLLMRVGEYISAAREAETERYLVNNIVDSARGVAIIVTDESGRVVRFNSGAERLLGYSEAEVVGRRPTFLQSDEAIAEKAIDLGVRADHVSVLLAMVGLPEGTQIRFRRKDGIERIHRTNVTLLTDAKGRPTGYLCTSEDMTDAVLTEEALRAALAAEQNAVERLRDIDTVKDTFVSTVSHELRTPITSILGYLELLSDGTLGGLDARQRDALGRVTTNSERLLSLINDLLTLSKVAETGVQVAATSFDLRDAVAEAFAVVGPMHAQRPRLTLDVVLPDDRVEVTGDRDMLERVVVNLLSNAVKFTLDGGSVHVVLEQRGREAFLQVRDNGIGIPEAEQNRLFSRFFRSSLAQGQAIPGSGLGLSITRSIVERHGGAISVTSAIARGTTVEVRLPLAVGNVKDSTSVGVCDKRR